MKTRNTLRRVLGLTIAGVMVFFLYSSTAIAAENLVVNGDAETGDLTGWKESKTYTTDVWIATDNNDRGGEVTTPHSGQYFFIPAKQAIPGDYDTFLYQNVDISDATPGDLFEISCYGHTWSDDIENEPDFGRLYLRFCYPDGTYMPDEEGNPKCMFKYVTIQGAQWTRYSIQMKMPEGAGQIQLGIWASQRDSGGYANVSFDDVVLVNLGQ